MMNDFSYELLTNSQTIAICAKGEPRLALLAVTSRVKNGRALVIPCGYADEEPVLLAYAKEIRESNLAAMSSAIVESLNLSNEDIVEFIIRSSTDVYTSIFEAQLLKRLRRTTQRAEMQ